MEESYDYVELPRAAHGKKRTRKVAEEDKHKLFTFPGPTKQDQLEQLYEQWFNCQRCFLGQLLRTHGENQDLVFCEGNPDADVMIIGEAPGEQEEATHLPFVGPAGQLLNILLADVSDDPEVQELNRWFDGVNHNNENSEHYQEQVHTWRKTEFFITNVVSCRPPENRTPNTIELKACWERLFNMIYIVDPLLIIVCENTALSAVTRQRSAQITRARGQIFDVAFEGKVGKLVYPVMPILHPSFLGRVADWKLKDGYWAKTREDLRKAMRLVDFLRHQYFNTPIPQR